MKRTKEYIDVKLTGMDIKRLKKGNTVIRSVVLGGIDIGVSMKLKTDKAHREIEKLKKKIKALQKGG